MGGAFFVALGAFGDAKAPEVTMERMRETMTNGAMRCSVLPETTSHDLFVKFVEK